jgi:hypothetical protein
MNTATIQDVSHVSGALQSYPGVRETRLSEGKVVVTVYKIETQDALRATLSSHGINCPVVFVAAGTPASFSSTDDTREINALGTDSVIDTVQLESDQSAA